jgi:hypothetical protein
VYTCQALLEFAQLGEPAEEGAKEWKWQDLGSAALRRMMVAELAQGCISSRFQVQQSVGETEDTVGAG